MSKNKVRFRLGKGLLSQYLLVFFAFLLMVLISNHFVGNIVSKSINDYGDQVLDSSVERISALLNGYEIILDEIAYSLEEMREMNGFGAVQMEQELSRRLESHLSGNEKTRKYFAIFGVVDDTFIYGTEWEAPDDFSPYDRLWYTGAYDRNGGIYFTNPYPDFMSGDEVFSVSKLIYHEGKPFGVVGIDINFQLLSEAIGDMELMGSGYGVMLDNELKFIVHPNEPFLGEHLSSLGAEYEKIERLLTEGDSIYGLDFVSYAGVDSVCFYKPLFNGWYVGLVSPSDVFREQITVMRLTLSATGFALMLLLCIVLTLMHKRVMRSDEATQSANAQAAAAQDAHMRTKIILDATPLGCKIWDKNLRIVECNMEAVKLFGLKDEQEFISRFSDLSPEHQPDGALSAEKAPAHIRKAFQEGRHIFEWMHQMPDGTPIPAEVTLVRVNYDDDVAVAGYIRDLREQKHMIEEIEIQEHELEEALDEAQHANKAKSDFLSNMSHEIRTPMNAVLGMTDLLLRESLNERQKGYVHDIHVSGQALLSIINDILDMSKIEAGKLELHPVNYEFHALLDNISSMFQFVAENKNIEFRFECGPNLPDYLFGDDIRLRQVLTNICGNAIKFTEKGYVRLKVMSEKGRLLFEVKDTGMGIKQEDMGKLFSAFSQADTEKNRSIVGTGLGLAISKAFVEMMGGGISLDSEYGQGTVFTVSIPLLEGNKDEAVQREKDEQAETLVITGANILVVDDNEFNLRVAKGLLHLSQVDAQTAASGQEAITLVQQNDYDLVFMDHMMPEMDGVETTAHIRKLGGKYETLPIVALTANAIHGAREMFLANGFNDFVSKPIDAKALSEILKTWLPADKVERKTETKTETPPLQTATAPQTADVPSAGFMDMLDGVEEIDKEIGLSRAAGELDIFQDMVVSFHKNLAPQYDATTAHLDSGDIDAFAISIHGMKSMLATIGAITLSELALELELAAKKGDMEYCQNNYPPLLEKLRALHTNLLLVVESDCP